MSACYFYFCLYILFFLAHIEFYNEVPVIPRSLLASNRENLILGSSCLNGEVFDTAMTRNYDDLKRVASFYDYLEVQPISNYKHLVDTYTVENIDRIKLIIMHRLFYALQMGSTYFSASKL